jgi:hypothetical protein
MASKKELEEKVKLLEARIRDLETIIQLKDIQFSGTGCFHDYPTPWFGTVPPACKKCGQQAPSYGPWYTISSSSGVITIKD